MKIFSISLVSRKINASQYYNKIIIHLHQVAKTRGDDDSDIGIRDKAWKDLRRETSTQCFQVL